MASPCQTLNFSSTRQFRERLPKKPYHTDQLGDYLRIHRAEMALQARYRSGVYGGLSSIWLP